MKKLSKIFGLIMALALFLILPSCGGNGKGGVSEEDCTEACEFLDNCTMLDEMGFDDVEDCIDGCVENAEQEQVDCILDVGGCNPTIWLCFADQDCLDACSKLHGCELFDDMGIDNFQDCLNGCMEDGNKEDTVDCIMNNTCGNIMANCL